MKSALLYADEVELVSPGAFMLAAMAAGAAEPDEFTTAALEGLDDGLLEYFGFDGGAERMREIVADYRAASLISRSERRKQLGADGSRRFRGDLAATRNVFEDLASKVGDHMEALWSQGGGDDLLAAADRGLLTLGAGSIDIGASTDRQVEQYVSTIQQLLADPDVHVIFDDRSASMVRSLANDGSPIHPTADKHAKKAMAATNFIDRLPAFPASTIDSLLQAREEISDLLHGYRRGVAEMSNKLEAGLADASLRAEVNDLWHDQVQPDLANLRRGLSKTRLAADAALHLLTDPKAVAAAVAGPALYFGVSAIEDLAELSTSALVAAAPFVVSAAASAVEDLATQIRPVRTHDLYYLLALERRL